MFPHHEDEIAQSEGAGLQEGGKRFVKYWLHGAHLLVEGKKMAKSLGNFFTLRDLLDRGYSGREVRMVLLSAYYRETFNFSFDGLASARAQLARIDECLAKLTTLAAGTQAEPDAQLLTAFTEALDNDLNVSQAWGEIFIWVREQNRQIADKTLSPAQAAAALAAWQKINSVLGLPAAAEQAAPAEVEQLLAERQAARKAKDFKRSDLLRDQIKAAGWVIEDTPQGPKLKRA